jgi:hypothetical protein
MSNFNNLSYVAICILVGVVIVSLFLFVCFIFNELIIVFLRRKFKCIDRYYVNKDVNTVLKLCEIVIVNEDRDNECSICLESSINKFMKLNCDHLFHEKCIKKWIENHNSCPICRDDIITI